MTQRSILVFYSPERICHSIFTSRIILQIREADERRTKDDAFLWIAEMSLMFATHPGEDEMDPLIRSVATVGVQDQA